MFTQDSPLRVVPFSADDFNMEALAERLTVFKSSASRTPTPVTIDQLKAIDESPTNVLLLQVAEFEEERLVVGMAHLSIIALEDRVHLGPIAIDKDSTPRGHGTPLMEAAIEYVKENCEGVRRIDLSNRQSHDIGEWYKKFGFIARTEENNDPATVYRLLLK